MAATAGASIFLLAFPLGSLSLMAVWEYLKPRRQREFPALRRRIGNIAFWLVNLILAAIVLGPPTVVRNLFELRLPGVLPSWPLGNIVLSFAAGLLVLDLLRYLVHRCEHVVPFLWRFHALHHSDPDVDLTTALRHHPIEYMFTSTCYWLVVIIFNIPATVVLCYGLAVFGMAAVQHGNIRFPVRLERWLRPVLITPDLHRLHHSILPTEANSNYGELLSVWDRLFGSYTRIAPESHKVIVFGVRELSPLNCLTPSAMLLTPWRIS